MENRWTYVSKIKSDLEILAEVVREFRVQGQNVQQIVPVYLVQITVGQRAHVARRLADGRVDAGVLAEYVVLAQDRHHQVAL